jgi:hypothetical protein
LLAGLLEKRGWLVGVLTVTESAPYQFTPSFPTACVKVQITEKHPSGAKARRFLSSAGGTTKVVP